MNRIVKQTWRSALCASFILATMAAPATAAIVDFEDVDGNGNDIITSTISRGFGFTSAHFHAIDDAASSETIADQLGSNVYIGHEGGNIAQAITMTAIDGSPFSVGGIDAARLWVANSTPVNLFPNALYLELVATFSAGGTSTLLLPLPTVGSWQTYSLSLHNLTSLQMNGVNSAGLGNFAIAVDNIQIIPEPVGPLLAILAITGLSALAGQRPL